MQSALDRWHELLDARAKQMDAAYACLGRSSADFWDRRARNYHRSTKESVAHDPFFFKVSHEMTPQTSVLDIGAGTGRFSLALAPLAHSVTAVEPNSTMLNYLRDDATEAGLTNISYIPTTWQDAPTDLCADVTLCSHVLYPIWDIDAFLLKVRAATLRTCYIYMRAVHFDSNTSHLWRHFHGDQRHPAPGYIHALDVLYEMGIYANVEVVRIPWIMQYPSLDAAVDEMLEQLILPDNEQTRAELRELLAAWLVERNGLLVPPVDEQACAIIHMLPEQRSILW